MSRLSIYLPPFASDYAGVCSALYDTDCLTVIADAKCCTSHVVYWDEPRWASRPRPTVSAQLRSIDMILGNDDRLVRSIREMDADLDPAFLALVGTPVPAITGLDLEGIACQLEDLCGKPAIGFDTGGFAFYDQGLYKAGAALLRRFCSAASPTRPDSLALLGLSPLDLGDVGNDADLRAALERDGWTIGASLFMGYSEGDLAALPSSGCSLAVSAAGLRLAKLLERRWGVPYAVGCPMGTVHLDWLLRRLRRPDMPEPPPISGPASTLLIMDQVMGRSLRQALRLNGCRGQITVATFFRSDPDLEEAGDLQLPSEQALIGHLRSHAYQCVVGDPMLAAVPELQRVHLEPFVHPAVSGKLHWAETPRLLSHGLQLRLEQLTERINAAEPRA